jgi:hypothetical protein
LLGYNALKKSDWYFSKTFPYLSKAKNEGKNIARNLNILKEASLKHIEILKVLEISLPETFIWQEEKSVAIPLYLGKQISQSIEIRRKSI